MTIAIVRQESHVSPSSSNLFNFEVVLAAGELALIMVVNDRGASGQLITMNPGSIYKFGEFGNSTNDVHTAIFMSDVSGTNQCIEPGGVAARWLVSVLILSGVDLADYVGGWSGVNGSSGQTSLTGPATTGSRVGRAFYVGGGDGSDTAIDFFAPTNQYTQGKVNLINPTPGTFSGASLVAGMSQSDTVGPNFDGWSCDLRTAITDGISAVTCIVYELSVPTGPSFTKDGVEGANIGALDAVPAVDIAAADGVPA